MSIRGQNPLLFHADIPLWQANYASAREDDGDFGEVARLAWDKAAREFEQFGVRDLPTTDGRMLRLNDYQENIAQLGKIQEANIVQRSFTSFSWTASAPCLCIYDTYSSKKSQ